MKLQVANYMVASQQKVVSSLFDLLFYYVFRIIKSIVRTFADLKLFNAQSRNTT